MTSQGRIIFFGTIGFGTILTATYLDALPACWRGLLILSGGWLMVESILYQTTLYAQQKDGSYYALIVFRGVLLLCMTGLTLFWFITAGCNGQ